MTPKPKPKKKPVKKKNYPLLLSLLFIFIAVVTVVLLEYMDFKNGKKSFIFSRIISLEKRPDKTEQFNNGFIQILTKNNISYDYFRDEKEKYHFELEIDEPRFTGLISRIQNLAGQLHVAFLLSEIQGLADKSLMLYRVELEQKITHLILITKVKTSGGFQREKIERSTDKPGDEKTAEQKSRKQEPEKMKPDDIKSGEEQQTAVIPAANPRLAFIIDDIGAYDIGAMELKKLNIPITGSVLADSPYAPEEVRWLSEYGVPAMIHLPMQPQNGDGQTYDVNSTVTRKSSEEDIRAMIRKARQIIPFAQGINNHQGSLATSDTSIMTRTLKVIREEGLFFIDSRTIGNTVAFETARQMGVKTASRDVFLDHVREYSHTMREIRRLTEIALNKGKAIAIGHPFPSTMQAIKDSIPYIRNKGVKIVFVADLVE